MGLSISSDNSLITQDLLLKLNQNYLNVTMGVAYSRYVRISVLMKFSLKTGVFILIIIKSCHGCVLESSPRGDFNTHPQHDLWRNIENYHLVSFYTSPKFPPYSVTPMVLYLVFHSCLAIISMAI